MRNTKLHKLISESVRNSITNLLKESYSSSSVFEGNPDLMHLAEIVYKVTLKEVENNYDDNYENNHPDFSEFVQGLVELYKIAKIKEEFNNSDLKQKYDEAVASGDLDSFWDLDEIMDYGIELDDYLNHKEEWDEVVPASQLVLKASQMFLQWLNGYTEDEIRNFANEKYSLVKYYTKTLNELY